ncbi:serine/threonine protein kinase [Paenibacillus sp. N1-5-1-14]|uniref:protein kinase domain-containing protein n=1 Tax=Paenibacillus radicibacter TaxID=2972488 RepID=UPI002158D87B|nr:serine/threonine protein kinase [Paenibacillus radicibacter]MCR8641272.1 serine/threonine protein kinase [Paenibacillus radicibacter]
MTEQIVTYHIDKVSFSLKEKVCFNWLTNLGCVFVVFDEQDSGNICFGVEQGGQKKFVKFAGVKTLNYSGDSTDAAARLIRAIPVYNDLKHPNVINLLDHFKVDAGYVAVFDWFEGENLHPHWIYPPPAKYIDPNSPFYKYKRLTLQQRMESLDKLFSFHVFIESKGYVAIDFYDGSILYDFNRHETRICDIDFYEKKPYINSMGRMWGSSRFMSPEEYELGAAIDSRTNVFNMGASAFVLLGGELDRSFEKWEASHELYQVACKAIDADRNQRYQSLSEFYKAWNEVRNGMTV